MTSKTTPMMGQYRRLRGEVPPDTILFFRLGDFYEMFFDDAREAAKILDIALTKRNGIPMCGVPYHAADNYLAKIIRAGRKVAICDQVEDPSQARGIVQREITRIVTPGTVLEEPVLDSHRHNYLAGLYRHGGQYGLALLDLSTGAFHIEETTNQEAIRDNLVRCMPSECLVPSEETDDSTNELLAHLEQTMRTSYEDWTFDFDAADDLLTRHFGVHSLEGFGCHDCRAGICAAGAVLHYVKNELRRQVQHIRTLRVMNPENYMLLDEATTLNLDLVRARNTPGSRDATLLKVLDTTCTAMGARMMRDWLLRPLTDLDQIRMRHDAVGALNGDWSLLTELRNLLAEIKDLERLISRLSAGGGNARDMRGLSASLGQLPALREHLATHTAPALSAIGRAIEPMPELVARIEQTLVEEPPVSLKEGGLIRKGCHDELDELRAAATEGKQWLAEFQSREQERTGIKSLKIRYNKVFGYYIEVTKSNLDAVPDDYVRKQTLVNAERYITPELKEYENKILGAQDRSMQLEYELFLDLRSAAVEQTVRIQQTAAEIARLDVLASLGERARTMGYVRPTINDSDMLRISDGRHPVIEQMPDAERFVPNNTLLDTLEQQLIIITGPNMAGKSTYIRQVALIVIMAQMGSFVPAGEAEIGVVDRVFTRVGAGDDLAGGRSTFMVEMQETANILNNATQRSLIVLDEIGRGTSTFDGISIAWAVAEYLHGHRDVKARTLFATHYHELTELSLTLPGIKNYNVLVREKNDQIVFLRKIVPGAADKSYGIQVARLAGLPLEVIDRAKEILVNLEEGELGEGGQPQLAKHRPRRKKEDPHQLSLFQ